ncbi:MAG: hypothetical protein O3B04_05040 [Chloroflexi bacterium]|nr:hypothetical protein [Chloroflexota bacterium]MDA1297354.1 hypothetical protein [Chloroflexota bacterium]
MTLAPIEHSKENREQQPPVEFPYLQSFDVSVANMAANDPYETVVGQGFMIMTLIQPEVALTEEEYPVLARIWDNDDDAIFDTM